MVKPYKAHLFVCTNKKNGKECCADKGAEAFRKNLKDQSKARWGKDVRINASGCLDQCTQGIAAVLYPEGKWFTGLKNDADDLERLMAEVDRAVSGARQS